LTRYTISGVEVYQDELTFEEFECAKKILKERKDIFKGEVQKFGQALDELHESGALKELVPIILRRYEPHIWNRWANDKALNRLGVTFDDFIKKIKGTDLARVMTDFFLLNIAWTSNLLILPESSNSNGKIMKGKNRTSLRNWFITWRNKIFSRRIGFNA